MEPDVWPVIAAWAGFAATAGAGFFTYRQARTARDALVETKRARQIASDQAHSARESATAASKSADAALWQATIAEKTLELAKTSKFEADRPVYDLEIVPAVEGYSASLVVRLRSGPSNVLLNIVYRCSWRHPVDDDPRKLSTRIGGTFVGKNLLRNQPASVGLSPPTDASYICVNTFLTTQEIGGEGREWVDAEFVEWGDPNGGEHPMTRTIAGG